MRSSMSDKLKETVADTRKRRLEGQETKPSFVSGDTATGTVRETSVEDKDPKPEEKPQD